MPFLPMFKINRTLHYMIHKTRHNYQTKNGIQVTIFDKYDRPGGLLTYGIPSFKLEKEIVLRRVKQLKESGVKFNMNCNVGEDISFKEITEKYNSTIIAIGVYKSRNFENLKGEKSNVVRAIDYLTASNRKVKVY